MDDDTIPTPTALEALTTASKQVGLGFLASKVVWTDQTPHLMNLPNIKIYNKKGQPFNLFDEQGLTLVDAASFVSLLVSRTAVEAVGLPIKEFFIWHDDTEFTERITQAGFMGGYVSNSLVLHKTPYNHHSNLYVDDVKNLWKYQYGLRNELFALRNRKGTTKFWQQFLKRVFVFPFRILRKRKDAKWPFIKTVWKAAFNAVNFNPEIEKL
jgi:GT2 family glycosyltransferase